MTAEAARATAVAIRDKDLSVKVRLINTINVGDWTSVSESSGRVRLETEVPATEPDPPYVDDSPDEAPAPTDPQSDETPRNDEVPE